MNEQPDRQLTPEEQKEFIELKSIKDLDEFITKTGLSISDTEKALVIENIEAGTLPLNDELLENVAGGFKVIVQLRCYACGNDKAYCTCK